MRRLLPTAATLRRCGDPADHLASPDVILEQEEKRVLRGGDPRSANRGEEQLFLLRVMASVHEDAKELDNVREIAGIESLAPVGIHGHRTHDPEHPANTHVLGPQIISTSHPSHPPW